MRRINVFIKRNTLELVRDPLMTVFCVGFPVILIVLLSVINKNIGANAAAQVPLFAIESLAPAASVFGLSFLSLFSGMLIAKDRSSSFLMRLYSSPMRPAEYIAGYLLPLIPIAVVQTLICFAVSIIFGFKPGFDILLCIIYMLPADVLYLAIGLLLGSLVNDKAVGGIASVIVNVSAWLGGTWFDVSMLGKNFGKICGYLPFIRATQAARAAISGDNSTLLADILLVSAWAILILVLASLVFRKKMKKI